MIVQLMVSVVRLAMTSLTMFRRWLDHEEPASRGDDRSIGSLECTETMDSADSFTDSANSLTPSIASIHERDMKIRRFQREMYVLQLPAARAPPQPKVRKPPPAKSLRQFLVIYTYYVNEMQHFRIVRARDDTVKMYERITTQSRFRKNITTSWLKYSPVRIFTHSCENAIYLWSKTKLQYPDFVYGMQFLSPTTFKFHDETSLRQRFAADQSEVDWYLADKIKFSRTILKFCRFKFIDADDCVKRCLTRPCDYTVKLQSYMMSVIETV